MKEAAMPLWVAVSGQVLSGGWGLCNLVVFGELVSLACRPLIAILNLDCSVCQEIIYKSKE
jgi:hypothetical protein